MVSNAVCGANDYNTSQVRILGVTERNIKSRLCKTKCHSEETLNRGPLCLKLSRARERSPVILVNPRNCRWCDCGMSTYNITVKEKEKVSLVTRFETRGNGTTSESKISTENCAQNGEKKHGKNG